MDSNILQTLFFLCLSQIWSDNGSKKDFISIPIIIIIIITTTTTITNNYHYYYHPGA